MNGASHHVTNGYSYRMTNECDFFVVNYRFVEKIIISKEDSRMKLCEKMVNLISIHAVPKTLG